MNRRSFLGSILAAAVAPAIVRADSLMRIVPRETVLIDPWFDNVKMLGHFDGDFTIESWIQPITGLVSEYRVTRGVARYDNLSIAALAFPAPAAGEWTYHCILRKAGSVGRTVIPLGATATGKSA